MRVGPATIVAGCLAMTAACATPPSGEESPATLAEQCDAEKAQSLVGQPATAELAAEAQRLSGAGTVRWMQPGQIVTMEYRADRLNVVLDAGGKVEAIRCG